MGQQHDIDAGRVETEIGGVLHVEVAAPLKHAAVDHQAPAATFDHMAGAGDTAVGAMKRQLHLPPPVWAPQPEISVTEPGGRSGSPFI